jgi:trimethylamine:corrinoid methyltransferase-like protein
VANGQPNINSNAKIKVNELLKVHRPKYIPKDLDNHIRKLFDIMISI